MNTRKGRIISIYFGIFAVTETDSIQCIKIQKIIPVESHTVKEIHGFIEFSWCFFDLDHCIFTIQFMYMKHKYSFFENLPSIR